MKVKQLIEILKNLDPERIVLVDGYEFGMEYLKPEKIKAIYFYDRDEGVAKEFSDIGGSLEEIDNYMLSNTELCPEAKSAMLGLVFHR